MNYTIFGVFVGSILGFLLAAFGVDLIIQTAQTHLTTVFVVGLIGLVLLSLIYLTTDSLVARLFRLNANKQDEDFVTLEKALERSLPNLPADGRRKILVLARLLGARVTAWRLRAMLISGIWGLAVVAAGLVATFVLVRQNELFKTQNTFLNRQIILQESVRFSVYAPLVTDVLASIAREGFEHQTRNQEAQNVLENEFEDLEDNESLKEFDSRLTEIAERVCASAVTLPATCLSMALMAGLSRNRSKKV